ncbi:hypothetical protein [Microbacterium arborescens]|uniref:hypothetical protein n=1 Tax=Microbacterium arborescens TaxID=33883 RepID=UPI00277E1ACE|nr:hypothetical protein [Microbacterium arborescens]MDQ1217990.1 hypothetical protein [Microbacterium arborescens]
MQRRSGAGPAPDTSSLREVARQEAGLLRTLPQQRAGRAPAWPFGKKATAAERALWLKLWKLPQAILWEEQHVERDVALYVRMSILVESGTETAAKVKSVRDQARTLLIELDSLTKAGYRISSQTASPAVRSSAADAKRAAVPSSRGRLQALPDPRKRLRGDDA